MTPCLHLNAGEKRLHKKDASGSTSKHRQQGCRLEPWTTISSTASAFIKDMAIIIRFLFFLTLTSTALLFPYNSLRKVEFESSGSGPNEPVQGVIKVVRLDPGSMSPSEFFRRGLPHRRALSPRSRLPFPDFLSRGRPGLAPAPRAPVSPLHNLSPQSTSEMELKMKKKQGLHMWQKVLDKGDKTTLPVNLKDPKQSCAAVSFVQVSVCFISPDARISVRFHSRGKNNQQMSPPC